MKVAGGLRQVLEMPRGDATIEGERSIERLVQDRSGRQDTLRRQPGAAEDNAARADKAVIADVYGMRILPAGDDVDGMSEQFRVMAGDGGESAHADFVRAIEIVSLGDGGVFPHDELRTAARLMGEMAGGIPGMARDPIAAAHDGMVAELDRIQVDGHGEMIDPRFPAHAEMLGIDPRQTNARRGIQGIAEPALQQQALEAPRQNQDEEL